MIGRVHTTDTPVVITIQPHHSGPIDRTVVPTSIFEKFFLRIPSSMSLSYYNLPDTPRPLLFLDFSHMRHPPSVVHLLLKIRALRPNPAYGIQLFNLSPCVFPFRGRMDFIPNKILSSVIARPFVPTLYCLQLLSACLPHAIGVLSNRPVLSV